MNSVYVYAYYCRVLRCLKLLENCSCLRLDFCVFWIWVLWISVFCCTYFVCNTYFLMILFSFVKLKILKWHCQNDVYRPSLSQLKFSYKTFFEYFTKRVWFNLLNRTCLDFGWSTLVQFETGHFKPNVRNSNFFY